MARVTVNRALSPPARSTTSDRQDGWGAARYWAERGAPRITGPAAEHADKLMLFGRFVGSWRLEWTGTDTGGRPRHDDRRAAFRLGSGWSCGTGHLDRSWSRRTRRGPAAAGVPRLDHPVLMTPRSMPGAPPGSNRSTAGYDASSAGPTAPTLCCSARRMTPTCGGASPTSRRTRSRGAPRVHATRVPAGPSTSRCWPPEITSLEPAHYRNLSAYGIQASTELAARQDGRACTAGRVGWFTGFAGWSAAGAGP